MPVRTLLSNGDGGDPVHGAEVDVGAGQGWRCEVRKFADIDLRTLAPDPGSSAYSTPRW